MQLMDPARRGKIVCIYIWLHKHNTDPIAETLQDWHAFLVQEYRKELCSRIPPEQVNDPQARKEAMKEFVDWHKNQIANFVDGAKHAGTMKSAIKDALKPVLSLVSIFYAIYRLGT